MVVQLQKNLNALYLELFNNASQIHTECFVTNSYTEYKTRFKTYEIVFTTPKNPTILYKDGNILNFQFFVFKDGDFEITFNVMELSYVNDNGLIRKIVELIYYKNNIAEISGINKKVMAFNNYFDLK